MTWWISSITPSAVTFPSWRKWLVSLHKRVVSYLLPLCLSFLTHSSSKFHAVAAPSSVPASQSQPESPDTLQDACQHYHTFPYSTTCSLGDQDCMQHSRHIDLHSSIMMLSVLMPVSFPTVPSLTTSLTYAAQFYSPGWLQVSLLCGNS